MGVWGRADAFRAAGVRCLWRESCPQCRTTGRGVAWRISWLDRPPCGRRCARGGQCAPSTPRALFRGRWWRTASPSPLRPRVAPTCSPGRSSSSGTPSSSARSGPRRSPWSGSSTNAGPPKYLVCVFIQRHGTGEGGAKVTHYWPTESASIAVGLLVSAVHQLGLGCLTYTPQPMGFLSAVLGRPDNERPLAIVAVGYPAPGYVPAALTRKKPEEYLRVV
jgi:hypothetical protein